MLIKNRFDILGLLERVFPREVHETFHLITAVLTVMSAITAVALRYAGFRLPIPVMDGQNLVEVQVQAVELVFCALVFASSRRFVVAGGISQLLTAKAAVLVSSSFLP